MILRKTYRDRTVLDGLDLGAAAGRVLDVTGNPVDERGPVKAEKRYAIHRPAPPLVDQSPEGLGVTAFGSDLRPPIRRRPNR